MGAIVLKFRAFLILCLFFISISFMSRSIVDADEGQVEFIPFADTYTDVFEPLTNYGGSYYLNIAYNEFAIQTIWLKFNLSHVPDGAIVDNATLRIFPTLVTATHEVSAYFRSNNSWDEYTINLIDQPEFDDEVLDTVFVGMPNKWYNWNVTNAVRKALDGVFSSSDVLTIVLKQTQWHFSYRQLQVVSREYGIRVSLYIHWSGSVIPEISILSPKNKTYAIKEVPLIFTANEPISWIAYSLDSQINTTISDNTSITDLSEGIHTIKMYANNTLGYMGYSGIVSFTVDTIRPNIEVLSPKNKTYTVNSVSLTFTIDEPISWIAYSLDSNLNVTITGNTTLHGLSDGSHSLVVYVQDVAGNTRTSETAYFSVETPQPELFSSEIVAVIVIVAAVGAVVLIYLAKKVKQQS